MIPPVIGAAGVLESAWKNDTGLPGLGSHFHFPRSMIGTGEGSEVRIKGTLQQRQLARTLRRLREEAGLSLEEAAPRCRRRDRLPDGPAKLRRMTDWCLRWRERTGAAHG